MPRNNVLFLATAALAALTLGLAQPALAAGTTDTQAAIEKDFGLKAGDVAREDNPLEKTVALVAKVNDLLPDSGPARAVYILGYKSKALIQVNVVWGKPVVEKPDLKQL